MSLHCQSIFSQYATALSLARARHGTSAWRIEFAVPHQELLVPAPPAFMLTVFSLYYRPIRDCPHHFLSPFNILKIFPSAGVCINLSKHSLSLGNNENEQDLRDLRAHRCPRVQSECYPSFRTRFLRPLPAPCLVISIHQHKVQKKIEPSKLGRILQREIELKKKSRKNKNRNCKEVPVNSLYHEMISIDESFLKSSFCVELNLLLLLLLFFLDFSNVEKN